MSTVSILYFVIKTKTAKIFVIKILTYIQILNFKVKRHLESFGVSKDEEKLNKINYNLIPSSFLSFPLSISE